LKSFAKQTTSDNLKLTRRQGVVTASKKLKPNDKQVTDRIVDWLVRMYDVIIQTKCNRGI